ncbi:MAG: polysaccharide biosynthesis/export family protein [Candidatus Sulfotelmatobacter sp.]
MEFGRFRFSGGYAFLAFSLIALSAPGLSAAAQESASSSAKAQASTPLPAQSVPQVPSVGDHKGDTAIDEHRNTLATIQNSSLVRLGPGDLLEISVYNVPELSTKARVGNSGDIYLPLIDYIHVGDLTVEEAQAVIEKRLSDGGFVRTPHVAIFLDESISDGVTLLGEVSKPGIYPAVGNRRLYDLISAAGGFTASAGRKVSIIHLHDQAAPITVNLPRNLADDMQDNIEIRPGDTITVPRAPVVYVVGDVGRPTGLLIDNGSLTVLQALALAGGANHSAKIGGTCIIHKGPNGMTETHVPLKKMLEAKSPDMNLQADDILFVPLSGVRLAAGRGFDAALSAATGLAVIAAH